MEPASPPARTIAQLGWLFFILGTIIFVAVMAYLLYALLRSRQSETRSPAGTWVVIIAGMIIPGIILTVLFIFNTNALGQVAAPNEADTELVIEITGNQWWWEVTYPEQQFETANEIHIPVGRPVLLHLRSQDVIHSFWVPDLHGKRDLIPGQDNEFWIQADEPGVYLGLCAEYCGTQHAKMQFYVIAEEEADFNDWIAQMQQPAPAPESESAQRGLEVFLSADCVQCHAIEGTDATGDLGPDLTHLAARQTIGAGILPMTRGNLGGWVADPQQIKPGVYMPSSNLSGEDLNALLDYLMSLQ